MLLHLHLFHVAISISWCSTTRVEECYLVNMSLVSKLIKLISILVFKVGTYITKVI